MSQLLKAVGSSRPRLIALIRPYYYPTPFNRFALPSFTTIAGIPSSSSSSYSPTHYVSNYNSSIINSNNNNRWHPEVLKLQKRGFLGCGDGDEGSALSKIHEERLLIGYSPQQIYAVVAAVDMYQDFLPWCQRSDILRHHPDGSFDAELQIGFKFLVESYVSHVLLNKPNMIKTTASESNLFEHLINVWEFSPGPTPETCSVYFLVDFKFRSPLYRQVASMFFKEVVTRLVSSFIDRCRLIYGPGATIEQKA